MLLYYIPTFWENFHKELIGSVKSLGKFSQRIDNSVNSLGKFSQRFFNERSD